MTTQLQKASASVQDAGGWVSAQAFEGFGVMVRFILRRNWLRMLIWTVVLAGMIALVVESQRSLFPTQADRASYAALANTPAIASLTGLPYAASTLGGILNIKAWMSVTIALALAVIFLVTRNGRAEEEAGRTELLRGGVLGRHAYTLANWVVAATFATVVGLATALVPIAMGLPADGAFVMGAIFTPPDVVSQLLLAVPLWLLYELGLLLARFALPPPLEDDVAAQDPAP